MSEKGRERFYFQRFQVVLSAIAGCSATEPDPPDFLVSTPTGRVGIELTSFYLPAPPGMRPSQELDALRARVVDVAQQMHADAGGPALYVSVFFRDDQSIRKADVRVRARELADALLRRAMPRSIHEPSVELGFGELPSGVVHVHAHGSVNGVDKLWQADAGGWVAPVSPAQVQAESIASSVVSNWADPNAMSCGL